MISVERDIFFISGATGAQGGAVAKALLTAGRAVRIFVRDRNSEAAIKLASLGAEVASGDFDDLESLLAAMRDVRGVFSMQLPPSLNDTAREVRTGRKLIHAARGAGVEIFVHSSVARAGEQNMFQHWNEGRWWKDYWDSKSAVNELVQDAGFKHHTILKPAYMMDNFAQPKASGMFPALSKGCIETAFAPNTRLDLIASDDIGAFAAVAFAEPARFNRAVIDLAAESLTMTEIAAVLSETTGHAVWTRFLSPTDAIASGINAGVVSNHEWNNVEGYKVNIAALAKWNVRLTSFSQWAALHRSRIVVG